MRLPRARFTIRGLMIAIATVAGLLFAWIEGTGPLARYYRTLRTRHDNYLAYARFWDGQGQEYEIQARKWAVILGGNQTFPSDPFGPPPSGLNPMAASYWRSAEHAYRLGRRFRRAAYSPWIQAPPPEPEPWRFVW